MRKSPLPEKESDAFDSWTESVRKIRTIEREYIKAKVLKLLKEQENEYGIIDADVLRKAVEEL